MEITQKERRLIVIIGGIVGLAIVLLIAGRLLINSSVKPLLNQLVASETETLRINELAQKQSPDLATSRVQANVAAIVTSDLAGLEAERLDVTGETKLPAAVTASLTNASAADQLKEAAQRSGLTDEYQQLLSASLQTSLDLAQQLKNETKRKAFRDMLTPIIEHLQTLQSQVESL